MKLLQNEALAAPATTLSDVRSLQFREYLYWCSSSLLSGMLAVPSARSFGLPNFWFCLIEDVLYLMLAIILTYIYTYLCGNRNWAKIVIGAVVMFMSSAVVFSLIRQNITLVVFASLFSFPGAIFGAIRPSSRS